MCSPFRTGMDAVNAVLLCPHSVLLEMFCGQLVAEIYMLLAACGAGARDARISIILYNLKNIEKNKKLKTSLDYTSSRVSKVKRKEIGSSSKPLEGVTRHTVYLTGSRQYAVCSSTAGARTGLLGVHHQATTPSDVAHARLHAEPGHIVGTFDAPPSSNPSRAHQLALICRHQKADATSRCTRRNRSTHSAQGTGRVSGGLSVETQRNLA